MRQLVDRLQLNFICTEIYHSYNITYHSYQAIIFSLASVGCQLPVVVPLMQNLASYRHLQGFIDKTLEGKVGDTTPALPSLHYIYVNIYTVYIYIYEVDEIFLNFL